MNRASVLLIGAVIAALSIGCANSKKKDSAASGDKYKVLNGSTSEVSRGTGKDDFASTPEPALNAETRFAAGQLAETQDKMDCAMVQYDQALRLNPNHVPSLYRMGVVLTKLKEYDKAVAIWKRYIKATGDVASSWGNLGFCYEMASDVPNAEAAYKEGLARDPKNPACRINYGLMLARQNRVPEAEVQLSAILKPDEVAFNLAAIYEQQGSITLAKAALKRALEANPNNLEAQAKLATLPQD